jgi:spermidine dehydrogenase
MNRPITRRDFLEGASIAVAGSVLPGNLLAAPVAEGSASAGIAPPGRSGLRGSHIGSFEVAHQLAREGRKDWGLTKDPDKIVYDLIVVGAGISGLSATHFYKKQHPDANILILDNHDDFGGHANRNEFSYKGQKFLGYGASQSLDGPGRFSKIAKGLLKDLRIDVDRFKTAYDQEFMGRWNLGSGVYFDRQTYGVDQVVQADLMGWNVWFPTVQSSVPVEDAVAKMPISDEAKRQLLFLYTASKDRVPDHSIFSEPSYLQSISYRDFLTQHMGVTDPQALGLLYYIFSDLFSIDVIPALWAMVIGLPGIEATSLGMFSGLMKRSINYGEEPYIYHFPDGNASVARLLVRGLIPGVAPGNTMEDIVGAPFDYSLLDHADNRVRLRLSSTAVHVRNVGGAKTAKEVDVVYVQGGEPFHVRGRSCVLACYNRVIPHLCPELPAAQRAALSQLVKVPLIYTNVLLRNWKPWQKLGIAAVTCPGTYHRAAMLDFPVSLGSVEFSKGPDDPIVLHMNRIPDKPGLPPDEQNRAGRLELLSTSFETIEKHIRTHLTGMLGGAGFDPALDIEGITVNRWPHGYAWSPNPLTAEYADDELPYVIGRQRFGRIAIANSDAGGEAYLHVAIDQAHRALEDLEG